MKEHAYQSIYVGAGVGVFRLYTCFEFIKVSSDSGVQVNSCFVIEKYNHTVLRQSSGSRTCLCACYCCLCYTKVSQQYQRQGFLVVSTQPRHNYLVVQQPALSTDKAAAAAGSSTLHPAAQGNSPVWPLHRHRATTAEGIIRNPRNGPSYDIPNTATTKAAQAAAVQATMSKLAAVDHVVRIEEEQQLYLLRQPRQGSPTQTLDHQNISARRGRSAVRTAISQSAIPASCPFLPVANIDADCGRNGTECVPYGVKMVQADHPTIIDISTQHKDKVLFCVIDTGLDPNTDFDPGILQSSKQGLFFHTCAACPSMS